MQQLTAGPLNRRCCAVKRAALTAGNCWCIGGGEPLPGTTEYVPSMPDQSRASTGSVAVKTRSQLTQTITAAFVNVSLTKKEKAFQARQKSVKNIHMPLFSCFLLLWHCVADLLGTDSASVLPSRVRSAALADYDPRAVDTTLN